MIGSPLTSPHSAEAPVREVRVATICRWAVTARPAGQGQGGPVGVVEAEGVGQGADAFG